MPGGRDDPALRGGEDRSRRTTPLRVVIRADGAARGNPGPAAAGAVLIDASGPAANEPGAVPLAVISRPLGIATNNVAEYTAVLLALEKAESLGAREVELILDSLLVVEQLTGRWKVKEPRLRALREEVVARLSRFDRWAVRHEPRLRNRAADALANIALDDPAAARHLEARAPVATGQDVRAAEHAAGQDVRAAEHAGQDRAVPDQPGGRDPWTPERRGWRPVEAREFYAGPGLNAETYDARAQEVPGGDDVAFYLEAAREHGGPILELGVGTGRVAVTLAEAGFDVVGIDRSAAMLAVAKTKRASLSPAAAERLRLIHGDMASAELSERFSLVVAPFRSFMMVTSPDAQRATLRSVHAHLRAGGAFIVHLFDPLLQLLVPGSEAVTPRTDVRHPVSGNIVEIRVLERVTDPLAQLLRERWRFTETDRSGTVVRDEEEILVLRWTYRYEMRYLLELAGFDRLEEYSDFAGSPPVYGGEQVWIARRGSAGGTRTGVRKGMVSTPRGR